MMNPQDVTIERWGPDHGRRRQQLEALRHYQRPTAGGKPATKVPATPFKWVDPTTLPQRAWLYGDHLIRKFVSLTIAPGGVGKSSLAIVEALAMASGKALLGIKPRGKLRVWYWCGEDPLEELQRRVMAAALHHGLVQKDIDGSLFLDSGRTTEIIVAEQTRDGFLVNEHTVEGIIRSIRENRVDVLIVDPFVSTHRIGENDNGAMDRVVKLWARIADETNCAVELVHHARKTGGNEVTVEDGRGAVALLAAARSARTLNSMSEEEARRFDIAHRRLHFRVDNGKTNLAPPPEDAQWYRLVAFDLENGAPGPSDKVGVVTAWTPSEFLQVLNIEDLLATQRLIHDGEWRRNVRSPSWVGNAVAKALVFNRAVPGVDHKIEGLLKLWIRNGSLKEVSRIDPLSRKPRVYVEVDQWADD